MTPYAIFGHRISIGVALVFPLVASLVDAPRARAAEPDTVFLADMTTTEVANAVSAGTTSILIPIGGTEQNGAHMALGKHNVRAKLLAERIARAVGNTLVAPVIAYVPEGNFQPPTAHMRFAGTISIPASAFQATLEGAAESFRAHGFRDVFFLGDHGSYQALEQKSADDLNRRWVKSTARAHAVGEYYTVTQTDYVAALKSRGYTDAEIGTHAGLADTSLMLTLDPSLVRTDALKQPPAPGVSGNPARSSAELGSIGVDLIVTHTVAAIRQDLIRH
jgi:creatinine amidohydrolase